MPDREYPDALPFVGARGRGAGLNPGNRFETVRLHVEGAALDREHERHPAGRQLPTECLPDASRSVVNHVDSPDLPFRWTLNPYRGCANGCVQPLERSLRITRRCLEVCVECRQPVSIVTKSRLVTRDIDLLVELRRHRAVHAALSVTTLDGRLAARLEPRASAPAARLRAIEALAAAGIPVTAMVAPIIPGLNDHEVPAILSAAADSGAVAAHWVMLRLPHQVKALFIDWLQRHEPHRAARVERLVRETRGGNLDDARFGARMRGSGQLAEQIGAAFRVFARRHGLDRSLPPLSSAAFRPPEEGGQIRLFG